MMSSRVFVVCCLLLLSGARPSEAFWKEVAGGVAGAGFAIVGAPVLLGAAGFTGAGIAAGSVGASMMSTAATYGAGMGVVGTLQAAGAAGVGVATAAAGAAVGAAAAHTCDDQE